MSNLNILDRSIGWFAPARAAKRVAARIALAEMGVMLRGYDAAKVSGRAAGWRATGGSANAEIGPVLDRIRKRTRDMANNDGWSASICQKLPAHMVGTGIVPRADSKDKSVRERCRDAWQSFVENSDPTGQSDFYGQSTLVAKTVVKSGEALVRWYGRDKDFGLRVPLQCEVLEPDYLDTKRVEVRGENIVIQGVEFDRYGRRVAYWLFPVHPGELGGLTFVKGAGAMSERVDAQFVDHVYRIDRPGQVRGVPWLSPILMTMRDTADYEEAELVRKKIAACLAFFVRSASGDSEGLPIGQVVTDEAKGAAGIRTEAVKPGRIHYLKPDQEVTGVDPKPSDGYAEYLAVQLRKAAAGVGLPYMSVTGDLTGANFSSMREGKLDFWPLLDEWQWGMLIPQHSRRAWRRVMKFGMLAGLKVSPDQTAIYTPPRRPWVDPVKDVDAKLKELAAGLESWPDAVAANGDDPEDQYEEIMTWRERLDKAGVRFKSSASQPANPNPAAETTDVTADA